MVERDKFKSTTSGIFSFKEEIFWARGYLAVSSENVTDEMIKKYIDEQEGEQLVDDSQFPIDQI